MKTIDRVVARIGNTPMDKIAGTVQNTKNAVFYYSVSCSNAGLNDAQSEAFVAIMKTVSIILK